MAIRSQSTRNLVTGLRTTHDRRGELASNRCHAWVRGLGTCAFAPEQTGVLAANPNLTRKGELFAQGALLDPT